MGRWTKKRPPQKIAGAYHLTYILYCSIKLLNIFQGKNVLLISVITYIFPKRAALKYLLYLRLGIITEV